MQNVHTFDGKLRGLFTPRRKHTIEEKEIMFVNLIKRLQPDAIDSVNIMIRDMHSPNSGGNYHPASEADATDILADILSEDKYDDILSILNEQLEDIKRLGTCDSGRVTRMYQVWQAHVEAFE
jgi:hypothetical protein